MKKILIAAAVLIVTGALGGDVFAAGTTTVNVSANIVGTCQFSTTPTLAFGALDQTSSSDATATGALTFWCTKGAAYTLSDPGGSTGTYSGSISNGTETIDYSISYTNATGFGTGKSSPISATLDATILNTDYIDATAGAYAGTVQFTIAP